MPSMYGLAGSFDLGSQIYNSLSKVHDEAFESPAGEAAFVGRAFFGGWDFDRGLGIAEELSGQGRRRHGRSWRGFSRPETLERDACEHDRSGEPSLSQGGGAGGEALLHGSWHPGETALGWGWTGVAQRADGTAERPPSKAMLKAKRKAVGHRITAGADKAYDTKGHVEDLRAINVTPHVAQNNGPAKIGKRRRSSIDARTTRHASYGMSQKRRKMIECIFGWGKQHGTMRKAKHRGVARIPGGFLLNLIAYNLIRIPKLVAA